jgi:hypothetical protein
MVSSHNGFLGDILSVCTEVYFLYLSMPSVTPELATLTKVFEFSSEKVIKAV